MRFLSGKAVFGWAFVSGDCVAATDDAGHESLVIRLGARGTLLTMNCPAYARRSADSGSAAHVGRNSGRRHAGEGRACRRCGVQGNRRGASADGTAAAREARGSGEVWEQPERSMGVECACILT
jgi:hypothetical protein